MFKIIYADSGNSNAFLRRRPGKQPYICFNKKLQGNTDKTLDALVRLMEVDRTLTTRQKLQNQTIYLEQVNNPESYIEYPDQAVRATDPQEADFCRN
jgi:hypothetical protein